MTKKNLFYTSIILAFVMLYYHSSNLWIYLDNSYLTKYLFSNLNLTNIYSTFDNWTIFWYEQTIHHNARWISNTFQNLVYLVFWGNFSSQIFIYFIFFIWIYFFWKKVLKALDINRSVIPLVLLMFNPITIYLLNQMGHMFSYIAPLIILTWLFGFYKDSNKYISLFYICIWTNLLLSYPRLTVLYWLFVIVLFFVFISFEFWIKNYFSKNLKLFFKKSAIVLAVIIASHLTLVNDFYYKIQASSYTKWALEYMEQFSKINWVIMYNTTNRIPINDNFIIREITWNTGLKIQNSSFYSNFFLFFLIIVLYEISKYDLKKYFKYKVLLLTCLILFLMGFLILSLPKYTQTETFIDLTFYKLPIFVNNLRWMYSIMIFAFILIIALITNQNRKLILLKSLSLVFSLLCIIPVFYNYKLTPIDHWSSLLLKSLIDEENVWTTFYPNAVILTLSWSYPIQTNLFANKEVISGNTRIVNSRQADLYPLLNSWDPQKNILFNHKYVILYKDIRNSFYGEYDYFPIRDYLNEAELAYSWFVNDQNLVLDEENEYYYKFSIKSSNQYDYSMYSPNKVHFEDAKHYFLSWEVLPHRTQLVDSNSIIWTQNIENFVLPNENSEVFTEYKKSNTNPTLYLVHLSNVDLSKNFLLQFNRTYSIGWKLKWISKDYYDSYKCNSDFKSFPLTKNQYCNFDDRNIFISSLQYLKFFFLWGVDELNHYEGNFAGNGWLISPEDLGIQNWNWDELYAVIYFEKQFWHILSIVLSCIILSTLVFLHYLNQSKKKS